MPYSPPGHPLEVLQNLNLDEAFGPKDPRFVNTDAARGGVGAQRNLARKFGSPPRSRPPRSIRIHCARW